MNTQIERLDFGPRSTETKPKALKNFLYPFGLVQDERVAVVVWDGENG